jgi:ABC-type amino acid transport substrate-binding protein
LLEEDPAVDLLASGISITPKRQKDYGIVFTKPILQYPQTVVTAWNTVPFVEGKLVLSQLGFVERTTSEELAAQLLASNDQHKGYKGSGAYDQMFSDLLQERIEGILLDKPYAMQKIDEFNRTHKNVAFATFDVIGKYFAAIDPEKIGWALRPADRPLLDEINSQLEQQKDAKAQLIKKFFPHPETFLPD